MRQPAPPSPPATSGDLVDELIASMPVVLLYKAVRGAIASWLAEPDAVDPT